MTTYLSRREALQAFVAAAGVPVFNRQAPIRRRLGIIGAGMAGVSLAWIADRDRDVIVLEARDSIGGNVQSVPIELDGHSFVVDIGAQYFHPGPYPTYTALLTQLGLHPPDPADPASSHSFPASISLTSAAPLPHFVSPVFPNRIWPVLAPWNQAGLQAFATGFAAAAAREQAGASWALSVADWLPTLGLSPQQQVMLLAWIASLFSGSVEQARGLSARAAMIFAAKALPPNPLDPLLYYCLKNGMQHVLQTMLDATSHTTVLTNTRVTQVARQVDGTFAIATSTGDVLTVDDLAFAASGPPTLQLLQGIAGTAAQRAALQAIQFHDARLAIHTDQVYVSADPRLWSFFNAHAAGGFCEASMWLAPVLPAVPFATSAKLWKSWVTHRVQQPSQILHEVQFKHMLPTPATLGAQAVLRALQGAGGLWFVGGYTFPFDSQETALVSALQVAKGLGIAPAALAV